MRKLKLTPLPTPKWPAPVQVPLDDDNLPDEIKMLVSEGNLESIVNYGSGLGMQTNYKVTYKKTTKTLDSVKSFLQINYFQMSVKEDQIDSPNVGGLNALVFLILGYHVPNSYILLKF